MKHAHKHLVAAALLAIGFAATAQTPPPAGPGGPAHIQREAGRGAEQRGRHFDPAKMQERMQERMARRNAALKEKLKITAAQEGAWTAFTNAMKPPASMMQRPQRGEFAKLTTPERIDRMRAMRNTRIAEMDKRGEATKTFYAALSAEQKAVFDAITPLRGERGGRGGRHGGPRHHFRG